MPLKHPLLWRISVVASEPAERAIGELLAARFGQAASSYTDVRTGKTTISVYLQARPAWSYVARQELRAQVTRAARVRSRNPPVLRLERIKPRDWAEAWKHHFKPLEIGRELLIKPSWSRRPSRTGQATVLLDPGMSFGTGQHPTTSFCLRELVRVRRSGQEQSFLDAGTGSGILAICAAKLGYRPIRAFDIDPAAVRIARANARHNHVASRIGFECCNLSSLRANGPAWSLLCANLLTDLLLAERATLISLVQPGGFLVLAGILKSEFSKVRAAYQNAGMSLVRSRAEGEWRSGAFSREF